jgi:WD40 repeat protein
VKLAAKLAHHHDVVSSVVLMAWGEGSSGAAARVAVASWDGSVTVWDPAAPRAPAVVLSGHTAPVLCAAASSSSSAGGSRLASGGRDCAVRVWSPSQQASAATVIRTATPATSLAWLPGSDSLLAAGLEDGSVLLFDLRRLGAAVTAALPPTLASVTQHAPLLALAAHAAPVGALVARSTAEGAIVISGGDDANIHVTPLSGVAAGSASLSGAGTRVLAGHKDYVRALAWADLGAGAGPQLLSGGWDKTVVLHAL